jgi:pimeloyl-ACP methyl ester carboxylesterase
VADPLAPDRSLATQLASAFAPRWRVLSIAPRGDCPYQVYADDLQRVLLQFGFLKPVLISSGLGAVVIQLLAAWYAALVEAVVVVDPLDAAPAAESVAARSLRDCPPDWAALTARLRCRQLVLHADQPDLVAQLRTFLDGGRIP